MTVAVNDLEDGDVVEVMYQPVERTGEGLDYQTTDEVVADTCRVVSVMGDDPVVEFGDSSWRVNGEETQYARLVADDPAPRIQPASGGEGGLYPTQPLPVGVINELVKVE